MRFRSLQGRFLLALVCKVFLCRNQGALGWGPWIRGSFCFFLQLTGAVSWHGQNFCKSSPRKKHARSLQTATPTRVLKASNQISDQKGPDQTDRFPLVSIQDEPPQLGKAVILMCPRPKICERKTPKEAASARNHGPLQRPASSSE